ncbi:hypothetical protein Tcan_01755, partial [Toxocara canis]
MRLRTRVRQLPQGCSINSTFEVNGQHGVIHVESICRSFRASVDVWIREIWMLTNFLLTCRNTIKQSRLLIDNRLVFCHVGGMSRHQRSASIRTVVEKRQLFFRVHRVLMRRSFLIIEFKNFWMRCGTNVDERERHNIPKNKAPKRMEQQW